MTLHDQLGLNFDEENQKRFNDFFDIYEIDTDVKTEGLDKKYLHGLDKPQVCRFCKKTTPEVTFKKDAHLIPQFFGNRYLLSAFECDVCNKFFGDTYESSFSNYLSAYRPFSFVQSGNNKYPKHKNVFRLPDGLSGEFTIQKKVETKNIQIVFEGGLEKTINFDKDKKTITLHAVRKPYTPLYNFKLLVKIAISIVPQDEVQYYENTIRFLMDNVNNSEYTRGNTFLMYITFISGPPLFLKPSVLFYKKRKERENAPYFSRVMVLYTGNHFYQIHVPFSGYDKTLHGLNINYVPFPVTINKTDLDRGLSYETVGRIMNGYEVIKDEKHKLSFEYSDTEFFTDDI